MPASRADTAGGLALQAGDVGPAGGFAGNLLASSPNVAGVRPATTRHGDLPAPIADSVPPPAPVPEKVTPPPREPVSERQTSRDALLPVASPTGNSDTTNYAVAADDTAVVQAAETLRHFADWTQTDPQRLRALNKLHKNAMVTQGKRIKLDLSKVTAAQFVAARRQYHHRLQESFFATHRIAGTETYAVKRGDSLWTIGQQRRTALPLWLVAEYNPDVNFNDMHPGTPITLPQVVDINRQ